MTIIIGYRVGGQVWLGADSMGSDDNWVGAPLAEPKIFRKGGLLIGTSGTLRVGQIIRYADGCPEPGEWDGEPLAFMVTRFVPWLRAAAREYGYTIEEDKRERIEKGAFGIVGFRDREGIGRVFKLCGDYGVVADGAPYSCGGYGYQVAMGAMWVADGQRRLGLVGARQAIELGILAASAHNVSCGGSVVIISTGPGDG